MITAIRISMALAELGWLLAAAFVAGVGVAVLVAVLRRR